MVLVNAHKHTRLKCREKETKKQCQSETVCSWVHAPAAATTASANLIRAAADFFRCFHFSLFIFLFRLLLLLFTVDLSASLFFLSLPITVFSSVTLSFFSHSSGGDKDRE